MLLLDAVTVRRDDALPKSFSFTALAPLYVDEKVAIAGHDPDSATTEVVAVDHDGHVVAKGTAVCELKRFAGDSPVCQPPVAAEPHT